MYKIKDLMTKNVVCIKKDTPLTEALEFLDRHNISGLPVVRDDMSLMGIISEKDMLKLFYSNEDLSQKTATNYMTQFVVSLDEDDELMNACVCLENHDFRRIPVTKEGKVTGVISRRDIIKFILWTKCNKMPVT